MAQGRLVAVALAYMALVGGCASAPVGVMPANELSHIADVEVVNHDKGAPPAYAAALRETVIREAAFYGDAGKPITLKIDLDKVHFKNVFKALLIGDDNQTKGQVSVLDPATGRQLGPFQVQVDAERSAIDGVSIAAMVIGAFDPTGLVVIASTTGSAASADIFRNGTAAAMIENFTDQTLRGTFGDAKAKVARQQKLEQQPRPH